MSLGGRFSPFPKWTCFPSSRSCLLRQPSFEPFCSDSPGTGTFGIHCWTEDLYDQRRKIMRHFALEEEKAYYLTHEMGHSSLGRGLWAVLKQKGVPAWADSLTQRLKQHCSSRRDSHNVGLWDMTTPYIPSIPTKSFLQKFSCGSLSLACLAPLHGD